MCWIFNKENKLEPLYDPILKWNSSWKVFGILTLWEQSRRFVFSWKSVFPSSLSVLDSYSRRLFFVVFHWETFTFCVLESWKETAASFRTAAPSGRLSELNCSTFNACAATCTPSPPSPRRQQFPLPINGFLSNSCILQPDNTLPIQWLSRWTLWLESRRCVVFFADFFCHL
jgi:hypothetical protein